MNRYRTVLGVRATLVTLVFVLTVPILCLLVHTSIVEQQSALETARLRLRTQTQLRAENQERLLEGVHHMLKVISHAAPLRNPVTPECSRYLRELHGFFPRYAHLAFADPQGNLVCRSTTGPGPIYVGDREYFKGAIRSRKFTVGEYLTSRVTGRPAIALSQPVYRPDGELHGVLYAVRELALIQEQFDVLMAAPGGTDVITDAQGSVIAATGQRPQRIGEPPAMGFLSQAVRKRRVVQDKAVDDQGEEWLYSIQPVNAEGAGGLVVASFVSSDSILGPATQRLRKELLIMLAITLVATFLAWHWGERLLTKPVERILTKLKALEHGHKPSPSIITGPSVRELSEIDRRIDDLGDVLGARSLQRDKALAEIHQQKLAIEASEQRYRAQFESSPQPMLVFDTETLGFLVVNDAAVTHYGYSREDFMVMTLADIRPPEDIPLLMETLQRQDAGAVTELLRRHRRKNGEIMDVELATHSLSWDGRPAQMMIVYDVTSRERAKAAWKILHKTLEQQVAQRTRELELANEELEAFSYSVSHDLRGPIQVIEGFAGALADRHGRELPQEASHYIARIRAGTRQMNALIEDLLALSRAGRTPLEPQHVDLAPLVRNTLAQLRQRFPARQVNVDVQEPLPAHCDPRLLAVLLDNLVGNAWKFTARVPQAIIRIGCMGTTADGVVFFVSDNGAGFDSAFAEGLFRPFQRLHSASEFDGTGVGLAIVYRIVRRHDGRVWAKSAVGEGATFFFSLPLSRT